ncbi:MAG: hypothetical protein GY851_31805 [bacterium]|nr:hypothetical protein [bacterium]
MRTQGAAWQQVSAAEEKGDDGVDVVFLVKAWPAGAAMGGLETWRSSDVARSETGHNGRGPLGEGERSVNWHCLRGCALIAAMNRVRLPKPCLLAMAACCVLPTACRSIPYEHGVSVHDPALVSTLRTSTATYYPDQFEAVHRNILTSLGYQFDMLTYSVARQPGDLRVVATSGMGGTLYEVTGTATTDPRILQNAAALPKSWLTRDLYGDARLVCLERPGAGHALVLHADGRYGLIRETGRNAIDEYVFEPGTERPVEYLRVRRGRCVYRARFHDFGAVEGHPGVLPRRVTIESFRRSYRQVVTLLELTPGPIDDALFDEE